MHDCIPDRGLFLVEIAKAFGQSHFDASRSGVYLCADVSCQRNQDFANGGVDFQNCGAGGRIPGELYVANGTEVCGRLRKEAMRSETK